jgi:hypothetical protein
MRDTYWILHSLLEQTIAELDTLNRKAASLKCTPITYSIGEEQLIEHFLCVPLTVSGTAPALENWQFIARLNHRYSGREFLGTIIRKAPFGDEIDLSRYRNQPANCEHCNQSRSRNDTFLVRHLQTGELKQVGSQCLKDFTGHSDPGRIAQYAEDLGRWLEGLANPIESRQLRAHGYSYELREFLALSAEAIARFGYISRSNATEKNPATVVRVQWNLTDLRSNQTSIQETAWIPSGSAYRTADETITWVRNTLGATDLDRLNDYHADLVILFRSDAISPKDFSYAASAVNTYLKQRVTVAADSTGLPPLESVKLGRISTSIACRAYFIGSFSTQWGQGLRFQTDDQNALIVWFTSSKKYESLSIGQLVEISGIIKAVSEYQGHLQNQIKSCKIKVIHT